MLEHTTFDDFMKGLYVNKVTQAQPKEGTPSDFQAMLNQIVSGSQEGEQELKLEFVKKAESSDANILGMSMEAQAMANIRERRKRKT